MSQEDAIRDLGRHVGELEGTVGQLITTQTQWNNLNNAQHQQILDRVDRRINSHARRIATLFIWLGLITLYTALLGATVWGAQAVAEMIR